MRIIERDYDAFSENHFPNMELVRILRRCKIWSAGVEQPLLVLVDNTCRRVTIFEYDTRAERAKDIHLVRHIREDEEGEGAGVPARIKPTAPSLVAQNVQPLPREMDNGNEDSRT